MFQLLIRILLQLHISDLLLLITACIQGHTRHQGIFQECPLYLHQVSASHGILGNWLSARYISNASVELKTDNDFVWFSLDKPNDINSAKSQKKKTVKMSKKAKLNELRFYRLKAKKKMNSPNPEVRIRYKLEKAKRKETWLIEKLRKFDVPKPPAETFDPEILTEEERHYLKRTGEKKKHYVPVGRRGVFGGVVLNMHLH